MQQMKTNTSHIMKEFTTIVQERGQITLPAEVRRGLGLKAKKKVTLHYDGKAVVIEPEKKTLKDYFGAFGVLPQGVSVEQAIKKAKAKRARLRS
ncbi:MAG: AbrB/MazE/SpoVT family DNA-binding domain-containing protein [Ktedonobacteraceae bacterium]